MRIRTSALLAMILIPLLYLIPGRLSQAIYHPDIEVFEDSGEIRQKNEPHPLLPKAEIRDFIDPQRVLNPTADHFTVTAGNDRFTVKTTLDMELQQYLLDLIDPSHARYIGIVAMSPRTGALKALVSFDRDDPANNACLDSRFPAASIFKIVTAAAAIEKCGMNPASEIAYTGRKYTLYKSQLKKGSRSWSHRLSLKDSFAQSVNPVFGKLGIHYVGKNALESYAEAFGFNRSIEFEIPIAPSSIAISEEPYHWAEIASGFNRQTTISPLHGALMVAAILNRGRLVEPAFIEQVKDDRGNTIYKRQPTFLNQAITPDASDLLFNLMEETVKTGTCRKSFRGMDNDPVLSKLRIGGKTGSINERGGPYRRYDWFVGFAEEKKGSEKLVISAVVAHEKYIGLKSRYYARKLFETHFRRYFHAKAAAEKETTSRGSGEKAPAPASPQT